MATNVTEEQQNVTLDDLMEELGNFGRYQICSCLLTCLAVIFAALSSLSYIFVAGEVSHRCLVPECEWPNASYDSGQKWLDHASGTKETQEGVLLPRKCERFAPTAPPNASAPPDPSCPSALFTQSSVGCEAYVFDNATVTVVNEWGLVCNEAWKRTLVGTINNLGQLVGLPIAGYLSDKIGRRAVLASAATLCAAVGLGRSFVNEYYSFLVLELLEPAFGIGIYSAAFVLCLELVNARGRVAMGVALNISFALGEVLLGGVAWLLTDWRVLYRIIYSPGLIFLLYAWLLPEPVRWLVARGRLGDARRNLLRAARCNRVTLDPQRVDLVFAEAPIQEVELEQKVGAAGEEAHVPATQAPSQMEKPATFWSVFRSRILFTRFLNLCYCWLTNTFVFYGLSLFSVTIAGNVYRNFMLASAVEMPAYVAMLFVTDRAGRRWCVCCGLAMSGCGCFVLMFPLPAPAQVTFLLVSKFCITLAFAVLYVYAAELFPTPMRHSVLSTCAMLGRIGAVAAPMTPLLASMVNKLLPIGLFASMAIVASLLTLWLPETVHLPLPRTVAEAENLGQQHGLLSRRLRRYRSTVTAVPSVPSAAGAPYIPPSELSPRPADHKPSRESTRPSERLGLAESASQRTANAPERKTNVHEETASAHERKTSPPEHSTNAPDVAVKEPEQTSQEGSEEIESNLFEGGEEEEERGGLRQIDIRANRTKAPASSVSSSTTRAESTPAMLESTRDTSDSPSQQGVESPESILRSKKENDDES